MIQRLHPANPALPDYTTVDADAIRQRARLFKLFADEHRLHILALLEANGELCVRDLWKELNQSQPAVSHHLALMRDARLVLSRHEGKCTYYRINKEQLEHCLELLSSNPAGV